MPTRRPRPWPRPLAAEKLVYLSDVNGVRRDKNDPDSLIHSLTAEEAQELICNGVDRFGHDPQGAGLPGDPRIAASARFTSSTAACGTRCCWKSIPARAWGRRLSGTRDSGEGNR